MEISEEKKWKFSYDFQNHVMSFFRQFRKLAFPISYPNHFFKPKQKISNF